jgi:NADPH:quinone reductase-like Zn-dependent oxidoreductase
LPCAFRQTVFHETFYRIVQTRASIIGTDFTGEIAATGSAVQSFKVGDKIMGFGGAFTCGSHAQYFLLPESKATKMMVTMPVI